jgi:Nif-specific regulatory protein
MIHRFNIVSRKGVGNDGYSGAASSGHPASAGGGAPVSLPAAGEENEEYSSLPGGRMTEKEQLVHAMETAGWVQAKAARLLNLTPRQIGYALRKHNIPIKRF